MSVQHSVLNVKAVEGAFNKEKALVGTFSECYENYREVPLPPSWPVYGVP